MKVKQQSKKMLGNMKKINAKTFKGIQVNTAKRMKSMRLDRI